MRGFVSAPMRSIVKRQSFLMLRATGVQGFAGQQFNRRRPRSVRLRRDCCRVMRVSVVVIFQIFENVADVEESIAVEADLDKRRLHAREDSRDLAFVNASDECELFFALDVNLD
jgi:hypothetical protein